MYKISETCDNYCYTIYIEMLLLAFLGIIGYNQCAPTNHNYHCTIARETTRLYQRKSIIKHITIQRENSIENLFVQTVKLIIVVV